MTGTNLGGGDSNDTYTGSTGENNDYTGDYEDTIGVAFHKGCVGTVKLKDIALKVVDQPHKYGTLLLASQICGHGDLRPEGALEIATSTQS